MNDEPDWDRVLRAIKGSTNTLAGWRRGMDGYGDEEMKRALSAAWNRPDSRIERLRLYREMAAALERELEGTNGTPAQ